MQAKTLAARADEVRECSLLLIEHSHRQNGPGEDDSFIYRVVGSKEALQAIGLHCTLEFPQGRTRWAAGHQGPDSWTLCKLKGERRWTLSLRSLTQEPAMERLFASADMPCHTEQRHLRLVPHPVTERQGEVFTLEGLVVARLKRKFRPQDDWQVSYSITGTRSAIQAMSLSAVAFPFGSRRTASGGNRGIGMWWLAKIDGENRWRLQLDHYGLHQGVERLIEERRRPAPPPRARLRLVWSADWIKDPHATQSFHCH